MFKVVSQLWTVLACLFTAHQALAGVEVPKDLIRLDHGFFDINTQIYGAQHQQRMCLTKKDMQDVVAKTASENECVMTKATRNGATYSIEMNCNDPESGQPMHVLLTSTLISNSQSKTNMVVTQHGETRLRMAFDMKRIRACTKEENIASQNRTLSLPNMKALGGQIEAIFSKEAMGKLKGLMDELGF